MKPLALAVLFSLAGLLTGCVTHPHPATETAETAPTAAITPTLTSLDNTSWALVRLRDEALVLPPNTRRPFLAFTGSGRLHGYTGVNRFSGEPEIAGQAISFGPMATTRMAGPQAAMLIETRFLDCLRLTKTWRLRDDKLELIADGVVLAIFNPVSTGETE